MDIKKMSAWLGHANAGFTYRVYHHYLPEKLDDREAERLNSFLFGGGDKKRPAFRNCRPCILQVN